MRKHLWIIGAAGFAGITLLGFSGVANQAYASPIPVAGIELTLQRYCQSMDLEDSLVVSPEIAEQVTAIPAVTTKQLAEQENKEPRVGVDSKAEDTSSEMSHTEESEQESEEEFEDNTDEEKARC